MSDQTTLGDLGGDNAMIYQTRYLDSNSDILWSTNINALSAEEAVATTVFFEWAPGSQAVQIVDSMGNEIYVISKTLTSLSSLSERAVRPVTETSYAISA